MAWHTHRTRTAHVPHTHRTRTAHAPHTHRTRTAHAPHEQELWSSIVVSRSLVFHEASFFLEDCSAQKPTLVAVGLDDVVVAPEAILRHYGSLQARLRGVRVLSMEGIGHGGWIEDDKGNRAALVAAVRTLRRDVANLGRLEGWRDAAERTLLGKELAKNEGGGALKL